MAENLSVKKSSVECVLECSLCLHQLTLPQTLQQCLHSFCKSCLDKVPQKTQDGRQGWLCPMCENFTKCDEIQQNTFIEELQKIQADPHVYEKLKCGQCSDDCGPASWRCAECKIGLCESAKIAHLRIPMLKGHQVEPLDSDEQNLIDNIVFCKVHEDKPAQLNCRDCGQMICYKCNITDHKHHNAETVEEALQSILPETESNIRQVDANIYIIEAQIEGLKKATEQTKESYASCRMQMDDHLEKVICRMRAMKAQMEEDVNEKESIALDKLKNLKQDLEKQLSQASITSNLTAVVTSKTKNASQLQQLQNGLFERVKAIGASETEDLYFQLPEANFIEGDGIKQDLEKIFGDLRFDFKGNYISTSGEVCVGKDKLMFLDFAKHLEVDTETQCCNRISYIDNKLWLPQGSDSIIKIYNKDGKHENTIYTGEKDIIVVREADNDDLICGTQNGLYVTKKDFGEWTKLADGGFSDVVVNQRSFFALDYDSGCIHKYMKADKEWKRIQKHKLIIDEQKDFNLGNNSTLCFSGDQFWVTSSENKELYQFNDAGKYVQMWKMRNMNPAFCGNIQNGKALLADYIEGKFYLLDTEQHHELAIKKIWQSLKVEWVLDAVLDSNNDLWTINGVETIKLTKYTQK